MALLAPARRVGIAAAALILAFSGALIPARTALASVVNPATGGSAIPADEFGTSTYTSLTGPAIAESGAGELALGSTTILNVPVGFRFHAGIGSLSVNGGCDLRGTLTESMTQVTFTVTRASTAVGCIATFIGLEVQPTSGAGLTSGNITKTGTSAAPGGATNYGTLIKVPGKVAQLIFVTQPSANNSGGSTFGTQPAILARDQFGNAVPGARVTLSIPSGVGPSGAHLTCSANPATADGAGVATFAGCKIDKAGSYRVRATSTVYTNSGAFQVKVGVATRLSFLAYPYTTTKSTFTAQPKVAVVDAGGNVVTTYPATGITIAINKHADHFACTGGLTATTVSGVATFRGCRETYVTSLYRLTAWTGFATVTGHVFAIKN